ncbi:hypothetical protein K3495_g9495 [Podosphaera aphanis]|nr:hypothetical protein K3495_g9495 [Podosphaera aphanis]
MVFQNQGITGGILITSIIWRSCLCALQLMTLVYWFQRLKRLLGSSGCKSTDTGQIPCQANGNTFSRKIIDFNGARITLESPYLYIKQKGQAKSIKLINGNSITAKDDYRKQRARSAYVASICQPEASFALSTAAQHQNPTNMEIKQLNFCLRRQIQNQDQGIRYILVKLETAKLFVFVDASFANNKDLSSQIGVVIVLANKLSLNPIKFAISGNPIHWTSVKCRRVTRAALASELYAMVHGVDLAVALRTTLIMITEQLQIPDIPAIFCINSFSTYECPVKLGTTKEKRLTIDIMAVRESYERRELAEIRWNNGQDNPADALTKENPTKALHQLIASNQCKRVYRNLPIF